MERDPLDELLKGAVNKVEQGAVLDRRRGDALWAAVMPADRGSRIWVWRIAVAVLLLLSTGLGLTVVVNNRAQEQLSSELRAKKSQMAWQNEALRAQITLNAELQSRVDNMSSVEQVLIKDTVVVYKERERVIVREKQVIVEVPVVNGVNEVNEDSLLQVIHQQEEVLAGIEAESFALNAGSAPTYLSKFNVGFENENASATVDQPKKSSIKINMSLFNRKKP